MREFRPVTLADVARAAGVSLTTASKAVNGRPRVASSTRASVLAVAQALGFVPDGAARSLTGARSGMIGLVVAGYHGRLHALEVLLGIEDALDDPHHAILLRDTTGRPDLVEAAAVDLVRRRVDGLIVLGDNNQRTRSVTQAVGVPTVYVYGETDDDSDICVLTDDEAGGTLATEHLLANGRRLIAHITGPSDAAAAKARAIGVERTLTSVSRAVAGGTRFGHWTRMWGTACTKELLLSNLKFDAVVAGSDQIANGVLVALAEAGIKVPGDVAVTGYDNRAEFCCDLPVTLTSVDLRIRRSGVLAAQALGALLKGKSAPSPERLSVRPALIARETTN